MEGIRGEDKSETEKGRYQPKGVNGGLVEQLTLNSFRAVTICLLTFARFRFKASEEDIVEARC